MFRVNSLPARFISALNWFSSVTLISVPWSGSTSTLTSSVCMVRVLSLSSVMSSLTCFRCLIAQQKNSSSELLELSADSDFSTSFLVLLLFHVSDCCCSCSAFCHCPRFYILLRSDSTSGTLNIGRTVQDSSYLVGELQSAHNNHKAAFFCFLSGFCLAFVSICADLISLHLREFSWCLPEAKYPPIGQLQRGIL